jgi:DNA repair exonuclease SbcCD ATPase subunit/DNA repair exonuclease SbcCD nuclease subunit
MRIIFSSDWQCSVQNLPQCQQAVDQICRLLQQGDGPKYFVHAGDIKETTNPVDQRVTNFIIESFRKIRSNCDGIAFVAGNHDFINTQDDVPSCAPVVAASGADWVAAKRERFVEIAPGCGLFLVPYARDMARQKLLFQNAAEKTLTKAEKVKTPLRLKILVFHNEVQGAMLSNYTDSMSELKLCDTFEAHYHLIVAGHIHKAQKHGPVRYVGSPFCQDWGECNTQHGVLVVDTNNMTKLKIDWRPSVVPGWYDPAAPGFAPPDDWKDARVRVHVPVNSNPEREIEEARQKLQLQYPGAFLRLVPQYPARLIPASPFDPAGGDEAVLRRYLETLTLPAGVTTDQITAQLKDFLPALGLFGVQGLKFGKTHAKETLCFEEIEFDWDRKGLTLLTGRNLDWSGSNGAGKSSFTTLPFLAMFGRTFKGQAFDNWARQGSGKRATIRQDITLASGRKLAVVRGRKPGFFTVLLDGKDVTMGDANHTQDFVESITNLTWSVLTNAVYIGQQEIGSVFGTDKERKELFTRLLGLDRFLEAAEKMKKILRRAEAAVQEINMDQLAAISAFTEAEQAARDVAARLAATPDVQPDLDDKKSRARQIEMTTGRNEEEKNNLEPVLEANQKQFEHWLFLSTEAGAKARVIREQLDASEKVKGRCHVCGAPTAPKRLIDYQKELKRSIEKAEEEAERYEGKQRENRAARKAMIEKVQKLRLENAKLLQQLITLRAEISDVQVQAEARRVLEELARDKQTRLRQLKRVVDIHDRALLAAEAEKLFLETCAAVVGRDGLPAYLTAEAAPLLNQAAAQYSEIFTEGEIGVRFEVVDGEIDVSVENRHGGEHIRDQSRGEMRLAALIAALAFRDALVKHNVLILDEPTDGLDPVNAAAFARGLNKVVDRFHHVVIVSHNERLLSELEPTLHLEIVKKSGVSSLHVI